MNPVRICFVCLGNICRSPTAEGVFLRLAAEQGRSEEFVVESAGTSDWHVGEPPDRRTQAEATRRGVDLSGLRGQQFTSDDFARFDLVVAMDRSNLRTLQDRAPDADAAAKVRLLRSFDPDADGADVPDPYAGGPDGFRQVYDMVEAACRGLLDEVRPR